VHVERNLIEVLQWSALVPLGSLVSGLLVHTIRIDGVNRMIYYASGQSTRDMRRRKTRKTDNVEKKIEQNGRDRARKNLRGDS
jgi:hypothetical protein